MKPRITAYAPEAKTDLADVWELITKRDGAQRATQQVAKIEAFCRSLAEMPNIGTRHPDRYPGLRSTGIPGLKKVAVLFVVTADVVAVVRIGYLGRNIWASLPNPANDNQP